MFNIIGTFLHYCLCRCWRKKDNKQQGGSNANGGGAKTRKDSGRGDISYRQYQPLDNKKYMTEADEEDRGDNGDYSAGSAEMVDLESGGYSAGAGYSSHQAKYRSQSATTVTTATTTGVKVKTGAKKIAPPPPPVTDAKTTAHSNTSNITATTATTTTTTTAAASLPFNRSRGRGRYTYDSSDDEELGHIGSAEASHRVMNPLVQTLKNSFR